MSQILQYNYVRLTSERADRVLQEWQSKKLLEDAITGLHENGEKIVSVIPTKYGINGELQEALVITGVEF